MTNDYNYNDYNDVDLDYDYNNYVGLDYDYTVT